MKILIISGFLGAGKTTFIKEMAKKTGRQFVILENDFGKESVDFDELSSVNELSNLQIKERFKNYDQSLEDEMKMYELSEGCICCSLNITFSHSLLTIANSLNPDYLIVEPSGVAHLSNILKEIKKITYEQISLLAPITIVNASSFRISKEKYTSYFNDQILSAGTVVLSHAEKFKEDDFLSVKEELNLNEETSFPTTFYSDWTSNDFMKLLEKNVDISLLLDEKTNEEKMKLSFFFSLPKKEEKFETISFNATKIKNLDTLYLTLLLLTSGRFGNIARAKGMLSFASYKYRFDLVENNFIIGEASNYKSDKITIIGTKLDIVKLKLLFEKT